MSNPRIEITPSTAQYEQLCRDLDALRKAGASSNTAAIVEAVHATARQRYRQRNQETAGRRRQHPGPATGG